MMDTKRRRRDAGSVRYGTRDLVGMNWCADQGAMRIDLTFPPTAGHLI